MNPQLDEYRKHIEKDPALERRVQPVVVPEPSIDETYEILQVGGLAMGAPAVCVCVRVCVCVCWGCGGWVVGEVKGWCNLVACPVAIPGTACGG
mgnify:CR=1 FL=1